MKNQQDTFYVNNGAYYCTKHNVKNCMECGTDVALAQHNQSYVAEKEKSKTPSQQAEKCNNPQCYIDDVEHTIDNPRCSSQPSEGEWEVRFENVRKIANLDDEQKLIVYKFIEGQFASQKKEILEKIDKLPVVKADGITPLLIYKYRVLELLTEEKGGD